jgi:protein-S-isoprenylcysteine O-methyltransferase Ste14
VRTGLGAMIVIAGMATMLAGHRALLRHGTNVNPLRPTTALVTDGVFRRTRNPLYVGVSVALCGLALIFALDWMLVLIVPACVILHFAVVRREESYLEGKFGEAYRRYKERVPRYLLD